ncbi:MAG: DUF6340 family protein [Bacteroidota bacterium]
MKRLCGLIALAGIFLLPGCYPAFIFEMEGLEPAELTVSASISTITVLSRMDLDSLHKAEMNQLGKNNIFVRDSSIAKEGVLGCVDELIESPRFEVYDPIIKRNLGSEFSDPIGPLPWTSIREATGDPPLDAVLSLESCDYRDTVITSISEFWVNHTYLLICKTYWRLYDLNTYQSKDVMFSDTTTMDLGEDSGLNKSASEKIDIVKQRMYWAGRNTGRRFAPYWTELERIYFPYGPGDFYKGAKYMREGNWTEAATVWNLYAGTRNSTVAAKACFDMAVTCELAGDIAMAQEWLDKSENLGMPEYYSKEYRKQLKERAEKVKLLDQQIQQEVSQDE